MCYICEARGHVGANYKAAQKEITAAIRVWGAPGGPRRRPDWQNAPSQSGRLWSNADLKAYGKQFQERAGVTP